MASSLRHLYEFGPYRLDAAERLLRRGEEAVHLTPKELDTLLALVRGGGRLMSKEELLREIWPDTFVGEATLAQNVFTLRRALGEAEGGKSYIETVPRRGYRFGAPVRELREGGEEAGQSPEPSAAGAGAARRESSGVTLEPAPRADPLTGVARAGAESFGPEEAAVERGHEGAAAERPSANGNGSAPTPRAGFDTSSTANNNSSTTFAAPSASVRDSAAPVRDSPAADVRTAPASTHVEASSTDAEASPTHVEASSTNVEVSSTNVELSSASIQAGSSSAEVSSSSAGAGSSSVEAGAPRLLPETPGHPVRAAVLISVVAFLGVATLVYAVYRLSVRPDTAPDAAARRARAFESMRVTRLPSSGAVNEAVISPDGKYFAYASNEPGATGLGIWIRQVGAASAAQQLVAPAADTFYGGLTFSPDSRHLYFGQAHPGPKPPSLYRVPILGGPPEKILEDFQIEGAAPVTFSPDGARMAFVRVRVNRGESGQITDGESALVVADSNGGGERTLVTRAAPAPFGLPAWSPDGRHIACVYGSAERIESSTPYLGITSFDASSGEERRVTDERWVGTSQLSWLPDSKGLVLSASEEELSPSQVWQLDFPSGQARRITNDLNTYLGASLTADGSALVTVQTDRAPNVWVAPAGDAARARQITTGSGKFDGYYGVAWMPDGRIVYASVASGSWDLWTMNADGTGQRQLTVGARSNYGPSVSPDGRHIAFVSNRAGGAFNIWRVDADGSNPLRLTRGRGENFPHFTPDGRWVVYATIGFGQSNAVWKVPADGGEPVKLTDKPASWPFVSPDGRSFVCTYGNDPFSAAKLAVIPIDGGEPTKLFDIPPTFRANTVWLPDNRGIAFLDSRTGVNNVWVQPLSGGKPVQLTDFKTDGVAAYDWSRDNRLAATRSVESTSVVLIRDFR